MCSLKKTKTKSDLCAPLTFLKEKSEWCVTVSQPPAILSTVVMSRYMGEWQH